MPLKRTPHSYTEVFEVALDYDKNVKLMNYTALQQNLRSFTGFMRSGEVKYTFYSQVKMLTANIQHTNTAFVILEQAVAFMGLPAALSGPVSL